MTNSPDPDLPLGVPTRRRRRPAPRATPGDGASASAAPARAPESGAGDLPPPPGPERLTRLLEKAEDLIGPVLAGDEEGIHDLRVTLKRVRVLCRELAGTDEGSSLLVDLRAGATALFRALAGIRDLDILRRELSELASAEEIGGGVDPGLASWIERERNRLRMGLPDAVAFFREQLGRLRAAGEHGDESGPFPPRGAARRVGPAALRRPSRRLLKALAKARVDPSPERLHRLRIRGKALRYTAEALREAGGESAETAAALESGLKKLQDALGAVQDATMVVSRLDGLGLAGTLPAPAVGPARVAAARELERRRAAFLTELDAGEYQNLLHEVKKVSAKQGDGAGGEPRDDRVPLEEIPGIGPAKARRLADAGLASPDALRSASLEELASVKTIGPHQARLIKEFVEESTNGTSGGAEESEPDGKRFERAQAVLALSATVSDYARTLAEELAAQAEGDAVRAGRQAERLADQLAEMSDRVDGISTKRLKSLRAELRETEGLLAKVLDVDSSSLKMNKLRKALKAHRKAVEGYIGG